MVDSVRANPNRVSTARNLPLRMRRFWGICAIFALWALIIVGRLFLVQVVRHKEFSERAQKQQMRTFEVAPRRGVLYDRNLRELAMTVQVDSIYAVPTEIADKGAAARMLAAVVHTDPDDERTSESEVKDRLENGHSFAWVARRVSPESSAKIKALNLRGIYFQKEFERFYPDNQIAAQVLGYVGMDDNGLGGVEQKFESQLHGAPGRMYTAMDARRRVLGSTAREPAPGHNLVLTIDEKIQFMAERALDHAMDRTHAATGTVVVQDVHTGQILALAIRPTFNPNDFRHTSPDLLRNHAVSDVYEPGSTFKLMTYSAALEAHAVTPDDIVDCQGGQINLAGRIIHDDKGDHFGRITVHEALEHSSDVAAVKLALKVGPDRFYQFARDFGFGSKTGLELPGETRGLLRPVSKWGTSSIGSIAMGQEVGVTPLQLVTMVSTLANGGIYLPPHLLMPQQTNAGDTPKQAAPVKPGEELPNPLPPGARRVVSTLTAAQMRKMMEGVVLYGTGKQARLNGYSSGGKTGTAQKIDPQTHTYSKVLHVASFAGIAPINNPVISVAVIIDSPKGAYYGAAVSAPVFADVAQQVLEYLGVPHDTEVRPMRSLPIERTKEDEADGGEDRAGDINALFAAANELPVDDPLRSALVPIRSSTASSISPQSVATRAGAKNTVDARKVGSSAGQRQDGREPLRSVSNAENDSSDTKVIIVSTARTLKVPSLLGLQVRKVIEVATASGLNVRVTGSGVVKEQAPAAGTMVPVSTQIVVKCRR